MKTIVIALTLVALLVPATIAQPDLSSRPLTGEEMALAIGRGCAETAGLMLGLAYTSGLTVAMPAISAGFLAGAILVGAGLIVFCSGSGTRT